MGSALSSPETFSTTFVAVRRLASKAEATRRSLGLILQKTS